jgi:hypothetical protein
MFKWFKKKTKPECPVITIEDYISREIKVAYKDILGRRCIESGTVVKMSKDAILVLRKNGEILMCGEKFTPENMLQITNAIDSGDILEPTINVATQEELEQICPFRKV